MGNGVPGSPRAAPPLPGEQLGLSLAALRLWPELGLGAC